jgi:hypothetical protein
MSAKKNSARKAWARPLDLLNMADFQALLGESADYRVGMEPSPICGLLAHAVRLTSSATLEGDCSMPELARRPTEVMRAISRLLHASYRHPGPNISDCSLI